jgi:adenylate cyclase
VFALEENVQKLQNLVNAGRFLEARELSVKLRSSPDADQLRVDQLFALSLSKSGSPENALAHLDLAYRRDPDDPETAGILGGIYKELFKKHRDSKYAILSRETYSKNFAVTRNYYTGINAATMSAIAGRASQGRELASQVISIIGDNATGFWELATLGEAYLLTKDRTNSIESYIQARQLAGNDWGKVISAYNQLWLLNHYVPVPKEIMRVFSPPTVAAFIGHMIDHPSRTSPRFPAAIEGQIKESIIGAIRTMNAGIAYCSVACGADIIFVEAMELVGAEVHLFIPFEKEDFITESVAFAGSGWVERFERLIKKFPVTYITRTKYDGLEEIFAFQCKIIFGSAMLRSLAYHQKPMLLSVQSEVDLKRKAGGTRDTLRLWPLPDRQININPDPFISSLPPTVPTGGAPQSAYKEYVSTRQILYMVAVDLAETAPMEKERIYKAVNNKMKDEIIPHKAFEMGIDNIFMAFETESGAIDFVQLILNSSPMIHHERTVKIGMHAAPVYLEHLPGDDSQVVEDENLQVLHQISTLAPKGCVCASDHFAALLALNPDKFQMDYAGVLQSSEEATVRGIYNIDIKV